MKITLWLDILFRMKPKDLKLPFKWEERRPAMGDQIFFIPKHFYQHVGYGFPSSASLFGNDHPLKVEYCSGNGSWIIERALEDRGSNYLAVEMRFDRARKIWSKLKNRGLSNLFVICGEAATFTSHYLPGGSVSEVFINFPDPFPKRRQAKHRLIGPHFLSQLERVMRPQGKLTFVTDDLPYLELATASFLEQGGFLALFDPPHFVDQIPHYGSSFFDELWRSKGRKIFYFQCTRSCRESHDSSHLISL